MMVWHKEDGRPSQRDERRGGSAAHHLQEDQQAPEQELELQQAHGVQQTKQHRPLTATMAHQSNKERRVQNGVC